jgi:hypothetical protein
MRSFFHAALRVILPKDAGAYLRKVETRSAPLKLRGVTIVSNV